jgi:hypothetical protein
VATRREVARASRNRISHFRLALGSVRETRALLDLAVPWGELPERATLESREILDRVCAILYRLTR